MKLPDLDLEEIRGYFEKYGQMEKYFVLTKEDFIAIGDLKPHRSNDLNSYLDFLDALWEPERERKMNEKCYSEPFRLK